MGALMSSAKSPAPTQWVLPFALSRFQTFRPGAPPPPGAAAAVPPSPVRRSVLPGLRGDGTPGLRASGPGPPTPSLGPVAAPGRADVGAPREARALRPRNRLRPGGLPEPPRSRARRARSGGALQAGPAGRAEPEPEPEPSPSPGGRRWVPRAGRGGRGGGRQPRTHQRRGCASRGRGPQSGGLMAGRGAGAPASHPPSRRRLQSD